MDLDRCPNPRRPLPSNSLRVLHLRSNRESGQSRFDGDAMPIEISLEGRLKVSDELGEFLQLYEQLIEAGAAALGRVEAKGEYHQAVALLAGQVIASADAVRKLCLTDRASQAHPINRSMVEMLINAHFLSLEPDLAADYWTYRAIPLAKIAGARARLFGQSDDLEALQIQAAEAVSRLHKRPRSWSALHLKERAARCGLGDLYDLYYPEGSAFSHGDSSMWNGLLSEDGKSVQLGSSEESIRSATGPAFAAGFAMLSLVAEVFKDTAIPAELRLIDSKLPGSTKRVGLVEQFNRIRAARP